MASWRRMLPVIVVAAVAGAAVAGNPKAKQPHESPSPEPPAEDAGSAAEPTQELPHVDGPKLVQLGNAIELDLPAAMMFYEAAVARPLLEKQGDPTEGLAGVVVPRDGEWSIFIYYEDVGYVEDSDADSLEADELFAAFQQGTTQQNEKRRQLGVAELFLDGWSERPHYDRASHHLLWGMKVHNTDGPAINYFTRVLGRRGFASVNLIDDPANIEKSKVASAPVIAALRFQAGSRYADHQSSDKDSGMSLRTLVLGGTGVAIAAKTGFLVKLLLVLKKAILFVVLAIGGFFKWLFGRKKRDAEPPAPPAPPLEPTATG